jgi:hypothetical protein
LVSSLLTNSRYAVHARGMEGDASGLLAANKAISDSQGLLD